MPIRVKCDECEWEHRLADEMVGKTVPCKHCGAAIQIPQVMMADPDPVEPESLEVPDVRPVKAKPDRPEVPERNRLRDSAPIRRARNAKAGKGGDRLALILVAVVGGTLLVLGGVGAGAYYILKNRGPALRLNSEGRLSFEPPAAK